MLLVANTPEGIAIPAGLAVYSTGFRSSDCHGVACWRCCFGGGTPDIFVCKFCHQRCSPIEITGKWQPRDEGISERARAALEPYARLGVDDCPGCGEGGRYVRYCPVHGLSGTHPR